MDEKTVGRTDGEPLDEEQIRADERARIARQLGAATEEPMAVSEDHRPDGSFDTDFDRDDRPLESPDRDRDEWNVPVHRDHDDRPLVAPDLDRDDRTGAVDRDRDDRPLVAADDQTEMLDRDRNDLRVVAADPDQVVVARDRDRDADAEIEVVRTRSFSVGQLLTMLVGAALVVLGVFALIETGIDTPLNEPIEQVMGYNHTPLLGIIEVGAGALLILFSLRPGGRWFVAVLGLALVLGGLLVLAEIDWTVEELGAESSYAWIPIVAGLVTLLSSLLTPRRHQRITGVPTQRVT